MKNKIPIQVSITILFSIMFFLTFIPDKFPEFFGDYLCQGNYHDWTSGSVKGNCDKPGNHLPTIHWGIRHWIWFWCGVVLFIYNSCVIIDRISKRFS